MDVEDTRNALIIGFANRYPNILDTETVFRRLIDSATRHTTRAVGTDQEADPWARAFIEQNCELLPRFARALRADDWDEYTALSHKFAMLPLPAVVAAAAKRREPYDIAVVDGLGRLGLHVTELLTNPEKRTFRSVWLGHDGGLLEVHEYDGLPLYVMSIEPGNETGTTTRRVASVAPISDTRLDARRVVRAARRVWS